MGRRLLFLYDRQRDSYKVSHQLFLQLLHLGSQGFRLLLQIGDRPLRHVAAKESGFVAEHRAKGDVPAVFRCAVDRVLRARKQIASDGVITALSASVVQAKDRVA